MNFIRKNLFISVGIGFFVLMFIVMLVLYLIIPQNSSNTNRTTTIVNTDISQSFRNSRNAQRTSDLATLQSMIARYLADSEPSDPRELSDIEGYQSMIVNATCSGGASGLGLDQVKNPFSVTNQSGTSNLNLQKLLILGYQVKIPVDPTGSPYKACIDNTSTNFPKLVIYAPNVEGETEIPYAVI